MPSSRHAVTRYYITLYMVPAVAVTYLPIWLRDRGVTDGQIGILNAVPMVAILLASVLVGRLADRAADWRQTILTGNLVAMVFALALGLADGFWAVLVIWTCITVPGGLIGPVADAATIRLGEREGFSFGGVRAMGTVGYMLTCVFTGYAVAWFGPDAFLWLVAGFAVLRAGAAALLPRMRDVDVPRVASAGLMLSRDLRAALHPWVLLPLIGGGLLFSTHLVMNGFSALVWKDQHISEGTIGALIAVGALAEAATMFIWGWFRARFAARHLVLLAAVVAVLRWGVMAAAPPVWVLFPLQALQGITFTFGFLGCLYFLADRTPEAISAEAQSFYGVLQQSASVLVVLAFGVGFQQFGAAAFLGTAALSALVAGMVLLSLAWHPPDRHG